MTLTMLHATLDQRSFNAWAAAGNFIKKGQFDEGVALHRLLTTLFSKGLVQPFRTFLPATGSGSLYAYTQADPADLLETARMVAPPEVLDVLNPSSVRTRPMPETFRQGQRLGFDLRIRPVTRGKTERDAFLREAETSHPNAPGGLQAAGMTREIIYRKWLAQRLEGAALLEEAHMKRYERKKLFRHGRAVEGPDVTFHGTLRVDDPRAFHEVLATGVGRHRAYGFGMLLLRPPGRPVPDR